LQPFYGKHVSILSRTIEQNWRFTPPPAVKRGGAYRFTANVLFTPGAQELDVKDIGKAKRLRVVAYADPVTDQLLFIDEVSLIAQH